MNILHYLESLIKAREKAKKATFVSDLSDDDDKANRKFKYKKTPYSTESFSSCPVYLGNIFSAIFIYLPNQ